MKKLNIITENTSLLPAFSLTVSMSEKTMFEKTMFEKTMSEKTLDNRFHKTFRKTLKAITALTLLSGCHTINYKEVAYSALRHNDCQRNQLEVFCTRSYQRDYREYERTRNELLQQNRKTGGYESWRNSQNNSIAL